MLAASLGGLFAAGGAKVLIGESACLLKCKIPKINRQIADLRDRNIVCIDHHK